MQWLALQLIKLEGRVFVSQFEDPRRKFSRLHDSRYLQANGVTAARHCDATLMMMMMMMMMIIIIIIIIM